MKMYFLKVFKRIYIFAAVFPILTQSCDIVRECEYGRLHADFTFSGKVTDVQGNPIEGIQVVRINSKSEYFFPYTLFTYTDKNGKYVFKHKGGVPVSEYHLRFRDVDGLKNGSFAMTDKHIKIEVSDYKGKIDGCCRGYVDMSVNAIMNKQ